MERFDQRMGVGQVDYVALPVGPGEQRMTVGCGIYLTEYAGVPVAIAIRRPNEKFAQPEALIEVISPERETITALLDDLRERSLASSVLRGKVISLVASSGGPSDNPTYSFEERPDLGADDVILPEGALEQISTHVLGIAENADQLRRHGQHLKRGILLYGPPGSGKTHTVRYLLSKATEQTVVLLSGAALSKLGAATAIARSMQPAIVVLEDCDLIAQDRDSAPAGAKPLLFELLDAMDGLDGDSDITFLLTTNRPDQLETALAQRPGRVDVAVEIPLPNRPARLALLRLYRGDAPFSDNALESIADQTEGMTASFAKELMRRAILLAVLADEDPADAHLERALADLSAAEHELTRSLLGNASPE